MLNVNLKNMLFCVVDISYLNNMREKQRSSNRATSGSLKLYTNIELLNVYYIFFNPLYKNYIIHFTIKYHVVYTKL